MKHLSTRVRVVIIAAILLAAGLAVLANAGGQSLPDTIMQTLMTPLKAATNALTNQAAMSF